MKVERKGTSAVPLAAKNIFFTSNYPISKWFPKESLSRLDALRRRIQKIDNMTEPWQEKLMKYTLSSLDDLPDCKEMPARCPSMDSVDEGEFCCAGVGLTGCYLPK